MIRRVCASVLLAYSWVLPVTAATSATFQVTASVVPGCLVVSGGANYGELNYGSHSVLSAATLTTSLSSGVQLQCTPGVTLNMSVSGGQNSNANSARNLKLTDGSTQLPYSLYSDAALSQLLEVGRSTAVDYSDASRIQLPIYGRLVLPGTAAAGTYTDTVQVQLTW